MHSRRQRMGLKKVRKEANDEVEKTRMQKETDYTQSLLRIKQLEEELLREQTIPLTSDRGTQRGGERNDTGTQRREEN